MKLFLIVSFYLALLNLSFSQYIDAETDTFKLSDAKLIAYSHGHYYKLGEEIGKFGWSVQKKKK